MSFLTRTDRVPRRSRVFATGVVLFAALALPASSFAQATRTWVSGVGDDANPCSRTAPCKTFAGAISKTAAGGEINVLDPGGFGAVTITKSITISAIGFEAGVLVSGTNGIVINAAATDKVSLIGLDIDGLNTSFAGVDILSAKAVRLENDDIYGFQTGVQFESNVPGPSAPRLTINNSTIHDNSVAGLLAVAPSSAGERADVLNSEMTGNNCGILVGATTCNATTASNANAGAVDVIGSAITSNTTALNAVGSTYAMIIGGDSVLENAVGLHLVVGGRIFSAGDNYIFGNNSSATPSGTVAKTAGDVMRMLERRARAIARARAERRHHRRHHQQRAG